jgi:1,4-dihydroxy-2-naphthoate octaprenyltransferase
MKSSIARWIFAAKPASWPKLLVPFVLGQAIGLAGAPSIRAFAIGLAFTVLDLLFVVFLNDYGDQKVDAIKRAMFGARSSKKTIPDGILSSRALLAAGILAGVAACATAFVGQAWLARPWLGALGILALAIFAAYTLPPFKLNYRGGGELLEMLGVGVVLPWIHAYLQSGSLFAPGLALLPGFALLCLSSAIASGLADERSDARGGKTTFVTKFGNPIARRALEAIGFAGACTWALTGFFGSALPWWVCAIPAMIAFWYLGAAIASSEAARTDAFAAQKRYKEALHRAIWRSALAASILLVSWQLIAG